MRELTFGKRPYKHFLLDKSSNSLPLTSRRRSCPPPFRHQHAPNRKKSCYQPPTACCCFLWARCPGNHSPWGGGLAPHLSPTNTLQTNRPFNTEVVPLTSKIRQLWRNVWEGHLKKSKRNRLSPFKNGNREVLPPTLQPLLKSNLDPSEIKLEPPRWNSNLHD